MSTGIIRHADLVALEDIGELLVKSGMFTDTKSIAQAVVKVQAGREIGLGPVESMRAFDVIEGKVSASADLLATLVKRSERYDYAPVDLSPTVCRIQFYQDGKALGVSEFTIEDAKAAGLANKDVWKKYPRNMLFARAMSNGVAWFCPDVTSGARIYVEGEIGGQEPEPPPPAAAQSVVVAEQNGDTTVTEHNGATLVVDVVTGEVVEGEASPATQVEGSSGSGDPGGNGEPSTAKQRQKLAILAQRLEWDDDRRRAEAGVASFTDLDKSTASRLIELWTSLAEGDPQAVESPGQGESAPAAETEDSSAGAPEPATPEQYNRLLTHYKNKRAIVQAIRARFGDETDYLKLTTGQATELLEAVMA